jgi:riboflavin biosynthesis pyrimidine reductase
VDKLLLFIAPIKGGEGPRFAGPELLLELSHPAVTHVGEDVLLEAYLHRV